MENTSQENSVEQMLPVSDTPSLPGPIFLLKLSIAYYKEHFVMIANILSVPLILSLIGAFVPPLALVTAPASVIVSLFSTIILLGLIVGKWDVTLSITELYKRSLKWFWPLVHTQAYAVLVVLGGFFLLLIPGIYAAVAVTFVMYVMLAEDKQGMPAAVESWYYVKGKWGGVFWRLVVLWGIFAAIGLVLVILRVAPSFSRILTETQHVDGVPMPEVSPIVAALQAVWSVFVVSPVGIIYTSFLYKALRTTRLAAPLDEERQKIEKRAKIFMIVGLTGLIVIILGSGFFILSLLQENGTVWGSWLPTSVIQALENISKSI